MHKRIKTTVAKAKALRVFVEPLLTRSKTDSTHSRRMVFKYVRSKEAVTELFGEIANKIGDRPGGYTRILRTGNRFGDNASMCVIELVDYNEELLKGADTATDVVSKKNRTRRGKKKDTPAEAQAKTDAKAKEATAAADAPAEVKEEAPKEEAPKKEAKTEEAPKEAAKDKGAPKEEAKAEEAPVEVKEESKTKEPQEDLAQEAPKDKDKPGAADEPQADSAQEEKKDKEDKN